MADPSNCPTIPESFDAAVLDALYEQIAVIDLSGQIIFINKAWKIFAQENDYQNDTFGLEENYLQIVSGTEVELGIQSVLRGQQKQYSYEYPCHSPTEKRWFWLYVTPLRNAQNDIVGAVTSHINMTERKLAELQIEELQKQLIQAEQNKVLVETAGAVAHEINQPLTAILGLSELLTHRKNLPPEITEDVLAIFESSQRIRQIVLKMQEVQTYTSKPYIGDTRIVDLQLNNHNPDGKNPHS